jgi:hypothetical protein
MPAQHPKTLKLRQLLASFDHPLRDLAAMERQGQQTVPDSWVGVLRDLGVVVAPGSSTTEVTSAIWEKAGALALEHMK